MSKKRDAKAKDSMDCTAKAQCNTKQTATDCAKDQSAKDCK